MKSQQFDFDQDRAKNGHGQDVADFAADPTLRKT